jgi:hypothetical protein
MSSFTDDPIEGELVEAESEGGILAQLNRSEIDMQIATAKKYPRNLKKFMNECRSMSCLDEHTASECFYSLPRSGKNIVGPSARFAEIAISAWGNCHAGARVIAEDEKFVIAQGAFYDLERNVRITYEVRRRVTDKNGRRYNDDMIGVTSNAACSIALRNAALKGIPKAYWSTIFEAAKTTAIGNVKSLVQSRQDMLAYFAKMGVREDRVLAAVEKPSVEDIDTDDLLTLKGIATALKDGDTTIEQAFPGPKTQATDGGSKSDALAEAAKKRRGRPPKQQPAEQPPEEQQEQPAIEPQMWFDGVIRRITQCHSILELMPLASSITNDPMRQKISAEQQEQLANAVLEAQARLE